MLKEASKRLLVASALGALIVPGITLAGGERAEPPAAHRQYDVTWPDGIAPGQEGEANGEGARIAGTQYDPTWPDGLAPGDEGAEPGQGILLTGARYDATWPDGVAPDGSPADASATQEPIYAGTSTAK